ncbi:MAG: TIGR03960 family B12-binding radical SAM protein [Desulfuromonadales bacterium]
MPTDYSFLTRLDRPSRYLGAEVGSITKNPSTAEVSFALAFPDVYEIGMSHIGYPILYHILNRLEWVAAERSYAPWPDMEAHLRDRAEPLRSLENARPLGRFDVVGFTLQYELSYTNVLNMMHLAGIPLRAEKRTLEDPLIVVGGPCAFNPEPLADFFDCAIIGDAEEAVVELCEALRESRRRDESRTQLLERLAAIDGIYVPSLFAVDYRDNGEIEAIRPLREGYSSVRRRFLADLDAAHYPTRPIVPFLNTVHDRVTVEIARGCTRGCRFCQAGYVYRPVRERSPQKVAQIIEESLERSGYDEVSLLSLSTGDYTCVEPLVTGLMKRYNRERVAVSLPSLRVGSLTPEMMEQIKTVRKTGFTLAPEAGTERLRNVINKGISEDDLLETTRTAFELGWQTVKLYFMLGLPTETDTDLEGIVELASRVKKGAKGMSGVNVNVSFSTFVPKPHTPFQWEGQVGLDETLRRQTLLRDGLRRLKLRPKWHDARPSFLEGVFARGDRRLGAVLERAVELGCRFDGWHEHFDWEKWQRAFADCGLDPAWYLRGRREDEALPWDHIDCGIPKAFFLSERRKALEADYTPDCRTDACSACGVCDFESLRMRLQQDDEVAVTESAPVPELTEDDRYKLRLRLHKGERARLLSHLEFMTAIHRAFQRAKLPVRYSEGYHPAPRISFSEALPLGVESNAEIIDIECYQPVSARDLVEKLNRELPEGIRALEGATLFWRHPSPSASIESYRYRVTLPVGTGDELQQRIDAFLAASEVAVERARARKVQMVDLRPDVVDLFLDGDDLVMIMTKGSPLLLASHLFGLSLEEARALAICKEAVIFK